uniref:Remorin C-terminal domain-containing protein n=1 Tax=Fagus sylvatica TaxID=28930 RepID=A0A2N9F8G6_FAGSY
MTTTTTSINSMANESQLSRSEERIPLTQCKYSSEGSCPAVWGMGSLMTVLPDSPSPICSGCSTPRNSKTLCTSQVPTGFSTARKKSSCAVHFDSKKSTSSNEVDKWMDNTKSVCHFQHNNLQNNQSKACDHEVEEESSIPEELSYVSCGSSIHGASELDSMNNEQQKMMTRLKPYHAFLDDVKRHEIEAEINAWKKAKYMKLINKLERKEAAINDWEFEKNKKAIEEMKKLEDKLARKRAQALKETEKKISRAKKVANKKTTKARRSTIEEMSAVSIFSEKVRATKSLLLLKLRKFC